MVTSAALREVAEYLAGQTLSVDVETVNFAMHFPRFFGAPRVFWEFFALTNGI